MRIRRPGHEKLLKYFGKSEGNTQIARRRHVWKDIKMDLQRGVRVLIGLIWLKRTFQWQLLFTVMNLRFP